MSRGWGGREGGEGGREKEEREVEGKILTCGGQAGGLRSGHVLHAGTLPSGVSWLAGW